MSCLSAKVLSCDSDQLQHRLEETRVLWMKCIPIEDPIFHARPRVLSNVLSLVPDILDLGDETLCVVRGSVLSLDALRLQV